MDIRRCLFVVLTALLSFGAAAAHPKDEAMRLKRLADEAFAAHRQESDKVRKTELLRESAEHLEKVVFMDGCADEALRVEATERSFERFRNLGDSDRALRILNQTLSAPPVLSPDSRLRLLMLRASIEEAKGFAKLAEKTYAEALRIDTRDMAQVARVRNRIATILTDVKGRHAEALKALDYRIEDPLTEQRLSPKLLGERAYVAGCALRGLKRYAEAKERLAESVKLFGNGRMAARGEMVLARVCMESGDRQGALAALDRAVANDAWFKQQAEHFRKGMEAVK